MNKTKPIIKWVGGKRELAPTIRNYYKDLEFGKYVEPFFGGGAIYLDVVSIFGQNNGNNIINDVNSDLINLYKHVKDNPEELMRQCDLIEHQYRQDNYTHIRNRYNGEDTKKNPYIRYEGIERSAALIVINRTCFNGMYRVNSRGLFNVPSAKRLESNSVPNIYDEKNISSLSNLLPDSNNILNTQFDSIDNISKGDLVYFDPPYHPLSKTSSFTSYSGQFGEDEQIRLRNYFKKLDDRGVYVIQSNSSADFIKEIYSDYRLDEVSCSRSINSKKEGRGKVKEFLIISNTLKNELEKKNLIKYSEKD
jgi:DNA adenine methylase